MGEWEHLSRAPIVEGLIDIRIEKPANADLAVIKALCDDLAELFPSCRERRQWTGQIIMNAKSPSSVATQLHEPDGFVLQSVDEKNVAQFRLDGFTYSRLFPYTSWKDLKEQAAGLWVRYCDAIQPGRITRLAVRFVNRIPLPPGSAYADTFRTSFSLPPCLPQSVAGFLLRLILSFEAEGAMAILSQTADPADENYVIFDIDVFSEAAAGFQEGEIWDKLESLRDIKNRIFFNSLTEATLETFK